MRHYPSLGNIVWTVLFSILLAVTLNACGDSNNVTGPPPPVPLSPDAKLSSLTVNPGPLPTFSSDVLIYTVDVATAVTSVTVTARAQNAGATVNINGQPTTSRSVSIGAPGSSTPIPIVVTAVSGSQNTYIVTVNRAAPGGDNNLSALSVTGQTLTPPFNASQQDYTVNVATTVGSVAVTARKSDPNAVMSGSVTAGTGQATGQATIPLGGAPSSTIVSIIVAAPNGSRNTYIVTVNRAAPGGDNNLSALSVTGQTLTPPFNASQQDYTVNVATTVGSVAVTARKSDPNAVMSGSVTAGTGQATGQATIPLGGAPSSTIVSIIVAAPNGSRNTYIVTVNRAAPGGNNNLQSLAVSPGSLAPTFVANRLVYTVNVASTVDSVTVTAQPQDAGATVIIAGQPTTSRSVSLGAPDSSTEILIEVTAPNGNEKTYAVTVNRAAFIPSGNNNLSALAVSAGALNEPFDAGTLNYTVTALASTTADTTVTATVADSTATLTINGLPATSGAPSTSIPLVGGANPPIPVVVTAENLTTKTYTITITVVP